MGFFFPSNIPQAVTTYGSDSAMTTLLNSMDVYVLPVFNIDGYVYTHTSVSYGILKPQVSVKHKLNVMLVFRCASIFLGITGQDVEKDSFQEPWLILHGN